MPHIFAFLLAQAVLISTAVAQSTTTAPDAAAPATDASFNPLWLLIVLALIAAAVWYFMRRRATAASMTTAAPPQTGVYDRDKP
jgi:LPXTG-motif cell wall-anchored protein